jgi:hypothetical protein
MLITLHENIRRIYIKAEGTVNGSVRRSRMVNLHLHSTIRIYGVVLNKDNFTMSLGPRHSSSG